VTVEPAALGAGFNNTGFCYFSCCSDKPWVWGLRLLQMSRHLGGRDYPPEFLVQTRCAQRLRADLDKGSAAPHRGSLMARQLFISADTHLT
jgi:hypothetical protein